MQTELEDFTLEPSDRLSLPTLEWLRLHGCVEFTTVRDVRVDMNHKVISAIQQVIDSVNSKAMTKADHIEKWAILPKDFSIVGGELGLYIGYSSLDLSLRRFVFLFLRLTQL